MTTEERRTYNREYQRVLRQEKGMTQVWISKDLRDAVKVLSKGLGLTQTEFVETALIERLERLMLASEARS